MEILTAILETLTDAGEYALWFALAYVAYLVIITLATSGTIYFLGSKALDVLREFVSSNKERPKEVQLVSKFKLVDEAAVAQMDELIKEIYKNYSTSAYLHAEQIVKAREDILKGKELRK